MRKKFLNHPAFRFALLVAAIFLLLFISNGVPFIKSDGYCYYHISRSLSDYGTFTSIEKPDYYDYRGHVIPYFNGKYADVCSVGPAIFNLPGILIAKQFRDPAATVYNDYFMSYNGHPLADGISFIVTGSLFGIGALVLLFSYFLDQKHRPRTAAFLSLGIGASAYIFWYVFVNPAYTHVYEFFGAALLLWASERFLKTGLNRYLLLTGAAIGIGFLARPTFALLALFFFIRIVLAKKQILKPALVIGTVFLPFFIIYCLYNLESYGQIITSGYNEIRGETFIPEINNNHFWDVLFSPQRGWFTYAPLFLISVAGSLILLLKKHTTGKALALTILGSIIITAFVYGLWPSWWGGGGYGARFLIVLAPLTAPGLSFLVAHFKATRLLTICLIVCVTFSTVLMLLYRFTPVSGLRPGSDSYGLMKSWDRYTPVDIFGYHFNLLRNADSVPNYARSFINSIDGEVSFPILYSGLAKSVLRIDDRTPGSLAFHIIPPPVSTEGIAAEVVFYLRDQNGIVYNGLIKNPQKGGTYMLSYNGERWNSASDEISIVVNTGELPVLHDNDFDGFSTLSGTIKLYFFEAHRIEPKGNPLPVNEASIYIL